MKSIIVVEGGEKKKEREVENLQVALICTKRLHVF